MGAVCMEVAPVCEHSYGTDQIVIRKYEKGKQ